MALEMVIKNLQERVILLELQAEPRFKRDDKLAQQIAGLEARLDVVEHALDCAEAQVAKLIEDIKYLTYHV